MRGQVRGDVRGQGGSVTAGGSEEMVSETVQLLI